MPQISPTAMTAASVLSFVPIGGFGALRVVLSETPNILNSPRAAQIMIAMTIQAASVLALVAIAIQLIALPALSFAIIPFAITVVAACILSSTPLIAYVIHSNNSKRTNITIIAVAILTALAVAVTAWVAPIAVPILFLAIPALPTCCCSYSSSYCPPQENDEDLMPPPHLARQAPGQPSDAASFKPFSGTGRKLNEL